MKTTNNTILITGGSAGIGFEIARVLSEKGNQVIITGRNKANLQKAASQLKNTTAIVSDVTQEADVKALVLTLTKDFPSLNVVINNAGKAFAYKLSDNQAHAYENGAEEMLTNYLSVMRLNEWLLPLLKTHPEAAIVNVTSIVAFAPGISIPTYSASKAALRSYTQALRISLEQTNVRVFELMPPLVNTDFSKDIGGEHGIAPSVVANDLVNAFEKNSCEIHVGDTAQLYQAFLSSPEQALRS